MPGARKKTRILLVKAQPDTQSILKTILSAAGYALVSASTVEAAKTTLKTSSVDLVLLDVVDDADWICEFCRFAKENEKTKDILVVLISTMGQHLIKVRAIEDGADDFITKPFNRTELLARVSTLVRLKAATDRLKRRPRSPGSTTDTNPDALLLSISRAILRATDRSEVLDETLVQLRSALDIEAGCVLVRDRDHLCFAALTDSVDQTWLNRRIPLNRGLIGSAFSGREIELVPNVAKDKRFQPETDELPGITPKSVLAVPVTLNGRTEGLLYLMNSFRAGGFSKADVETVRFAGEHLSLGLEHLQVLTEVSLLNEDLKLKVNQATEAIVDLTNFNESIIQNISSGVVVVDLDKKITFINNSAQQMLEWGLESAIGQPLSEIFGGEQSRKLLEPTAVSGKSREIEIVTKAGQKINIGFSTTRRYDAAGRFAGSIVSFKDITRLKELRKEFLKMERLAPLWLLSNGIAHEIRNPLAGIKTIAQALERELDPDDDRREYVARIIKQINRLNELLKNLFTYAKPSYPVKSHNSLNDILKNVLDLSVDRMKRQHVELIQDYDPELTVYVDFVQMEQILLNLVVNALDSMDGPGQIKISARTVKQDARFGEPEELDYAEIKVSDSGSGIRQEDLALVFDPFFTTKSESTGLGLSITHRIVDGHHGKIFVESELNRGTTFTILMPSQDVESPAEVEQVF